MDKATLLAAVIEQVKALKKNAMEASKGLLIPLDDDKVIVESFVDGADGGTLYFKASLCCDYRPELLFDIRQAIEALPLKMVNAEISTLGSRVKSEFLFTNIRHKNGVDHDADATQLLTNSIHLALNSILEKGTAALPEYSPTTTIPNKRRRITLFDSSSSSS